MTAAGGLPLLNWSTGLLRNEGDAPSDCVITVVSRWISREDDVLSWLGLLVTVGDGRWAGKLLEDEQSTVGDERGLPPGVLDDRSEL